VLKIGSLFSGIGGLELGIEQAVSARTAWQVEIDPWCRSVLQRHWPEATRHEDVREVGAHNLEPVDLLCGGFPCQDVSAAGRRAGLEGARSGLWFEFARIISEMRPRWVVVENVTSGRKVWLPAVLSCLQELGYEAQDRTVSAASQGAPHRRLRTFVVASLVGSTPLVPLPWKPYHWPPGIDDVEGWRHWQGPSPVCEQIRAREIEALGNAVVPTCAAQAIGANSQAQPFRGQLFPTPKKGFTYAYQKGSGGRPTPALGYLVQRHGFPEVLLGGPQPTPKGRYLNHAFVECLMGFPLGWTDVVT
jgi:DNA (cytosine-5)-methyltransferase 1